MQLGLECVYGPFDGADLLEIPGLILQNQHKIITDLVPYNDFDLAVLGQASWVTCKEPHTMNHVSGVMSLRSHGMDHESWTELRKQCITGMPHHSWGMYHEQASLTRHYESSITGYA